MKTWAMAKHRLASTAIAIVIASALIAVGSAVGIGTASAGPVSTGWGCANSQIIAVPGTWETNPTNNPRTPVGLLKEVTDHLDNRSASINYIPYTARMVDTSKMIDSWNAGFQETNRAIAQLADKCPRSTFALLGFSQGAGIMGDVATNIGQGTGPIPANKVERVALISDPLRSPGSKMATGQDGYTSGGGILGVRSTPDFGALADRVLNQCGKGDYICNVNQTGTIIPNLAAHFTNVSLTDPNSVVQAITGALAAFGLNNVSNLFTSVLDGKTDPLTAGLQLPGAVLSSFGTLGTGLQVPPDIDVANALQGAARGDLAQVKQVLGGTPIPWGVIGSQGIPLLSYLFKGIGSQADFMARVAGSLAEIGLITPEKHGYLGAVGPSNTPATEYLAQWINPTLSGAGSLLS